MTHMPGEYELSDDAAEASAVLKPHSIIDPDTADARTDDEAVAAASGSPLMMQELKRASSIAWFAAICSGVSAVL